VNDIEREVDMRKTTLLAAALASALMALPARAPAQVQISVAFGARLGPQIGIFAYSADHYGPWRTAYVDWTPVTVYYVNGRYYRHGVSGARAVVVYRYHDDYFFPPRDRGWNKFDRRYDYRHRPDDDDWGHARDYSARVVVDPRLGTEIELWNYSAERAGDWRTNYTRWTPVIVYEYRGQYYPHRIEGARAVAVYRYRYEYFLPPTDAAWVGADRRYDYAHRPSDDDRGHGHGRGPGPTPGHGRGHGKGRGGR
jgi:hypothetical protein